MRLTLPHDEIAAFCRKWNVSEFALFGSVLRDDFRPDSDVDVLVTWAPEARISLFEHVDMQDELEALFGRRVDLVSKRGVEQSTNRFRKQAILGWARTIYPSPPAPEAESGGTAPAAEPLDRNPALLFEMLETARLARDFTAGMAAEQFARDRMSVSAVSRVLGQMGRAAGKVSEDVRQLHPQIDWTGMARFADRLLQEYRDVSADEVWRAAQEAAEAIPVLEPLIPPMETENEEQSQ